MKRGRHFCLLDVCCYGCFADWHAHTLWHFCPLTGTVRRVMCKHNVIVVVCTPVTYLSYMSESEQYTDFWNLCCSFLQTKVWHFVGVFAGEWQCQSFSSVGEHGRLGFCFVVREGERLSVVLGILGSNAHWRKFCGEWCGNAGLWPNIVCGCKPSFEYLFARLCISNYKLNQQQPFVLVKGVLNQW